MTTLNIMSSGDHGNVDPVYAPKSITPTFPGSGGSVPLNLQKKGSSIDCEEFAQLRLVLTVATPTNNQGGYDNDGVLIVSLEHSHNELVWKPLMAFEATSGGEQREVVGAFERYVRASWFITRRNVPHTVFTEGTNIVWSLTAEAIPTPAA